MTGLDWVIVLSLILFTWNGYRVGLIRQVTRVVGLVAGYFVARTYAGNLAPAIEGLMPQHGLSANHSTSAQGLGLPADLYSSPFSAGIQHTAMFSLGYAISFAVLFFATQLVIAMIGTMLGGIAQLPVLSFINKIAGAAAGLVLVVLAGSIALHVMLLLPVGSAHSAIAKSKLSSSLLAIDVFSFAHIMPVVPKPTGPSRPDANDGVMM